MSESSLPPGFEALEPFVAAWSKPRAAERAAQRIASNMEELKRFYDAVMAQAEEALTYLDKFDIGALPEREQRLMNLLLSLPEAANAVEVYRQPFVPYAFRPERYPLTEADSSATRP